MFVPSADEDVPLVFTQIKQYALPCLYGSASSFWGYAGWTYLYIGGKGSLSADSRNDQPVKLPSGFTTRIACSKGDEWSVEIPADRPQTIAEFLVALQQSHVTQSIRACFSADNLPESALLLFLTSAIDLESWPAQLAGNDSSGNIVCHFR